MTVSIKDVAALAGVSPKTVSRVINGEAHVKSAKREAVMKAVSTLDYRPNAFARSLSSSRSYLLALLTDDPRSSYAADLHLGALNRCRELSYHLLVEHIDRHLPDWAERLAGSLDALKLDGAILSAPLCDDPNILDLLDGAGIPFVRLSPSGDEERSSLVMIDDVAAASEMTRHLVEAGHTRIGFVKGPPEHSATNRRYSGFVAEMARQGLTIDSTIVAEGDFSARSGFLCGERILAAEPRPTAIFASNDDMALGVLMSAVKLRLHVPDQLAVAGFDDAPLSSAAWPQLTTVRQPNAEMAATAVDFLVQKPAQGRLGKPQHITLGYELIRRRSTLLST